MPAAGLKPLTTPWLVGILGLVTLGFAVLTVAAPVDDAFIVYRYADRLAAGKGLTFNEGQYVEGFTSLIWTSMLGFCVRLGIPVETAAVGLNLAAIIATFAGLWWALRVLGIRHEVRLVILLLFSLSTLQFKVALLGLEFGIFAVLLVVFATLMIRLVDSPPDADVKTGLLLAGTAGALFLTRPETVLFLPALYLFLLFSHRLRPSTPRLPLKTANLALAGFLLIVLVTTSFRWSYFHQLLPQTVSAKRPSLWALASREGVAQQLEWIGEGGRYFVDAYARNPALLVILALAIWTAARGKRTLQLSMIVLPILLHHFLVISMGGDWMPFDRFLSVFEVLFLLLLAVLFEELAGNWSRTRISLVATSICVVYVVANLSQVPLTWPPRLETSVTGDHLYGAVGKTLRPVWHGSDTMVSEAIGRIGFVLPAATILDPEGLVSPEVARRRDSLRSVYGRSHWPFVMAQQPAVVVIHSLFSNRKGLAIVDAIENGYSAFCVPPLPNAIDDRWMLILVRGDREQEYLAALQPLLPVPLTESDRLHGNLDLQKLCSGPA